MVRATLTAAVLLSLAAAQPLADFSTPSQVPSLTPWADGSLARTTAYTRRDAAPVVEGEWLSVPVTLYARPVWTDAQIKAAVDIAHHAFSACRVRLAVSRRPLPPLNLDREADALFVTAEQTETVALFRRDDELQRPRQLGFQRGRQVHLRPSLIYTTFVHELGHRYGLGHRATAYNLMNTGPILFSSFESAVTAGLGFMDPQRFRFEPSACRRMRRVIQHGRLPESPDEPPRSYLLEGKPEAMLAAPVELLNAVRFAIYRGGRWHGREIWRQRWQKMDNFEFADPTPGRALLAAGGNTWFITGADGALHQRWYRPQPHPTRALVPAGPFECPRLLAVPGWPAKPTYVACDDALWISDGFEARRLPYGRTAERARFRWNQGPRLDLYFADGSTERRGLDNIVAGAAPPFDTRLTRTGRQVDMVGPFPRIRLDGAPYERVIREYIDEPGPWFAFDVPRGPRIVWAGAKYGHWRVYTDEGYGMRAQ